MAFPVENPPARRWGRPRLTARDVRDALIGVLPTAAALLLASWVLDGLDLTAWTAVVVAVVVSVADVLVRPVLRLLAGLLGAAAALLIGLVVQVGLVWAALAVAPGTSVDTVATAVETLVLVAAFGAVGRWLIGASDRDYLVADLLRRAERQRHRTGGADGPGAAPGVVVRADRRVPYPVLRWRSWPGNRADPVPLGAVGQPHG